MSATTAPAPSTSATRPTAGPLAVQPYLFFEGRCEEALGFYRDALGAQIGMISRFRDAPTDGTGCTGEMPPADKVMHASLRIGATELYASDGRASGKPNFAGIALSLPMSDGAAAARAFDALSAGGSVQMPLGETFYATHFGMVTDRFGVQWMIIVPKPM